MEDVRWNWELQKGSARLVGVERKTKAHLNGIHSARDEKREGSRKEGRKEGGSKRDRKGQRTKGDEIVGLESELKEEAERTWKSWVGWVG